MSDLGAGMTASRIGFGLVIAMIGGTLVVLPYYPGGAWVLLAFGAAAAALAVVGWLFARSTFCRLLTAFLCVGFWAKLIVHLSSGAELIEPIGQFEGSPTAWDRVLVAATVALGAVAIAVAICGCVDRYRSPAVDAPRFARLAIPLFIFSAIVAVALFAFNRRYAILAIGFIPHLALHSYVYVAISFIVSWGAMLWLGALACWLVLEGRWPIDALFYLAGVEGALAAVSMGSRAQMILHVAAVALVYVLWRGRLKWRIPLARWVAIIGASGVLFAVSLAAVSIERVVAFHGAAPAAAAEPAAGSGTAPAARADTRNLVQKLNETQRELARLVVMRWIGLEGVMAMTAAEGRGLPLFLRVVQERPEAGNDAIYQRISNAQYERLRDFVFLTLPGPVAVLLSSGGLLISALGMMLLVFAGYAVECFSDAWTKNPAASSVASCALAFLIANMNFPRTLFFFTLTLILALGAMGMFRMSAQFLCKRLEKSGATDTASPGEVGAGSPRGICANR